MFRYLDSIRNLFRKTPASQPATAKASIAAAPVAATAPTPRSDGAAPIARVETASLQLAAIIAKFPAELKALVIKPPPPEAMVALPLPTILKFLPTGSVKMSLASVVRQAPAGTFTPLNAGDKRLVEVPLAEIFKRVSPAILKKRTDQRASDLAAEGFDIFGDEQNPRSLAPRVADELAPSVAAPAAAPAPAPSASRAISMPALTRAATPAAPRTKAPTPAPTLKDDLPPLVMPLKELADAWPEAIKAEVQALNGTTVALPSGQISAGLARGKVAFAWGQLRSWMAPPPGAPSAADEGIELSLPLRVVAPAFMKHSKAGGPRKTAAAGLDETIPALFGPAAGTPPPPVAAPAPAPQPKLEVIPARDEEEAAPAPLVLEARPPQPPAAEAAAAAPPAPHAPSPSSAAGLGAFLGQPDKSTWAPNEIIAGLCGKPGIAGAVVALQEGLVIAHQLPEPFKGEVFAAFLPQLFARLNKYAGEMKLGTVDELTITADGAPCFLFRRGQVFVAVLGQVDSDLSIFPLRQCADALASQ